MADTPSVTATKPYVHVDHDPTRLDLGRRTVTDAQCVGVAERVDDGARRMPTSPTPRLHRQDCS